MIRVDGLRFTYPGNEGETLRGLSFGIEPGEIFGFLNAWRIKDLIAELKRKGKTVFLTTHNMHGADELCDSPS